MKEFLFLAGRIRALESKLLNQSQIERMVGAASPEAAFRVLTELQYAEYLDTEVEAKDFSLIIRKGLSETKELINSGTDNTPEFQFIWREFDLNNIKRALKAKLVEKKTSLESFEDKDFSFLGDISLEDLNSAIFDAEFEKNIPQEYVEIINTAESIYEESSNFSLVELAADKAHFAYLFRLAKSTKSSFLLEFLSLHANTTNLRTLLRLLALEIPLSDDCFVSHGTISTKDLCSVTDFESFVNLLIQNDFYKIADEIKKQDFSANKEEMILSFERLVEKNRFDFLRDAADGDIGSIKVPLLYFLRRYKNASTLKFIMFAKIYNIAPEQIYKTIHHLNS